MARAGYCQMCQKNVWLAPDGSCSNGHAAGYITGIYDTDQPAAPEVAPPARRTRIRPGIIIAVVLVSLLMVACCVGLTVFGTLGPVYFGEAQQDAAKMQCFAQQKVLEGSALTYAAEHDNVLPPDLEALVPEYLDELPVCPSDGAYVYEVTGTDAFIACDLHGSYRDAE